MKRITCSVAVALLATSLLTAATASAWDHRAMQSHHEGVARRARVLEPGAKRIGRIEIGAPATAADQMPGTLERASQRQWIQRNTFNDEGASRPASSAPRIRASRSEGTPGR